MTQFRHGKELLIYDQKVYVNQFGNFGKRKLDSIAAARRDKNGKYNFSVNARKRFKRAVNNLSLLCKPKFKHNPYTKRYQRHEATLLTLTIPEVVIIDGRYYMDQVLLPFMDFLTRTATTSAGQGIKHYVWKIEKQKRGQLHFHLITDEMVDILQCRRRHNQLLNKAGLLKRHFERTGNFNPGNSTDVKSFGSDDIAWYLSKEFLKKVQNPEDLTCRTWGCSDGLEEPYFTIENTEEFEKKLRKIAKEKRVTTRSVEHATFIWSKGEQLPEKLLSKDDLTNYEIRIQIIGGVIERPKPILMEDIPEVLDIIQEPVGWVPVQLNLWDG